MTLKCNVWVNFEPGLFRALKNNKPGLFQAWGLFTTGPKLGPDLRAWAWALACSRSTSEKAYPDQQEKQVIQWVGLPAKFRTLNRPPWTCCRWREELRWPGWRSGTDPGCWGHHICGAANGTIKQCYNIDLCYNVCNFTRRNILYNNFYIFLDHTCMLTPIFHNPSQAALIFSANF